MTETDLKQKVVTFFNVLSRDTLSTIDDFYDETCIFNDPVVHLKGLKEIRAYYATLYQNVTAIRFEFGELVTYGLTVAAPWTMHLTAPKLKKNGPITVPGLSYITFSSDGKALYHRDYFDMGAFVYENVPLLGSIIRFIKRRLH